MHVKTNPNTFSRLTALPLTSTTLTDGLWAARQAINRQVTLQHGHQMLEKSGNFDNFRIAAGMAQGEYRGMVFNDSDVYKWLEAASYSLAFAPDPDLEKKVDEAIRLLATAQAEDGYVNTHFQITGKERFSDLDHAHELYCAGHLIEAAVAHHRATGKKGLMAVACRFADHIESVFGPGPDKRRGTCGHPEIELALVELYRETGEKRYLDLALFFVNERGQGKMRGYGAWGPAYHQDRVPVRQADQVEGHAVRQLYLNAGVADLYLETGEQALLDSMHRQWQDMVAHKMYLTGGFGARHAGEAFGDSYELPSRTAYCETCAAIAGMMWNWRMLLATGDARFADVLERSLYNNFLSGWSHDGRCFFYVNPLESPGGVERKEWYECACCPPNIMRQIAMLGSYVATTDSRGVQIHQYIAARVRAAVGTLGAVALSLHTDYPWSGKVRVTVDETPGEAWALSLRIPPWANGAQLSVNGQPAPAPAPGACAVVERAWQPGDSLELDLPMSPQLVAPHPYVDDVRGCIAIERGPLVYCLEAADQADGVRVPDVRLLPEPDLQAEWRGDLLGGLMAIKARGLAPDMAPWQGRLYLPPEQTPDGQAPIALTAIPYYAWANRGPNAMRVWIPRAGIP